MPTPRNTPEKVLARIDHSNPNACWPWTGKINQKGYGHVSVGGRVINAHRYLYEALVGPVAEGLVLDHLCRVTHCCNPTHLEPVTQRENLRRGTGWPGRNGAKTHCHRGHELAGHNLLLTPEGYRQCRMCRNERTRRYAKTRRAKAAAR